MRIEIGKYFAVLLTLSLLVACAPMDYRISVQDIEDRHATQNVKGDFDHAALAKQYEDLAREMQAKVREQEEIFKHKPRSGYFGKRGNDIKSHIAYKIQRYEKAAQEYLDKAAYHRKISANINLTNEKNKAKRSLNDDNKSL